MVGDNRWIFSGGLNLQLVRNAVDCRAQQALLECAQLFAMGSSGTYYDERCGKYGFSRPTATASGPIERTVAPAASTAAPIPMDTTPAGTVSRPQVRQRF
jgi:hypothetical protein